MSDTGSLVVVLLLLALALSAPFWGTDSRVSREWSDDGPHAAPAPCADRR